MSSRPSIAAVLKQLTMMDRKMTVISSQTNERFAVMEDRFKSMEKWLTRRFDVMETNLSRQIDGIDERLDELELLDLPRRVTGLEMNVGK